MSIGVSSENEQFVQQQIALGVYTDERAALDAALNLLRIRTELLLRIDEGRRQLDTGEFTEFDDPALGSYFESLKDRIRNRAVHALDDGIEVNSIIHGARDWIGMFARGER